MASQRVGNTNFLSTIIRVSINCSKTYLATTGQLLTVPNSKKRIELLKALRNADRWAERLRSDPSATQSDIAKEEGICRTRVSQILQLKRLPKGIRTKLEHAPEQLEVPINIHSLRKLALSQTEENPSKQRVSSMRRLQNVI